MATLNTQTGKINAVISIKGYDSAKTLQTLQRLEQFCKEHMQLYAFILHDKDILDNGELKTPHIHLCGLMKTNRQRLSKTLNDIATYCELSTLAVSIDKMSDLVGSLHYLIHKDNADKHQYTIDNIFTNISSGEMATYMASDSKSMSIEYLIGVVTQNRSKIDIMRIIGLTYYNLYRQVINDIYKETWEVEVIRQI